MKKFWYLFKETTYHIVDNKFVQDKVGFYLYDDKTEIRYQKYDSLEDAINREDFQVYKESVLSYPIIKGTVPLFESPIFPDYSHYVFEQIRRVLPEIKIENTFIDKVPIFKYTIRPSSDSLNKFVSLALKYKSYIETKDLSFKLTLEEKERLEEDLETFLSVILLHTSEQKPTVKDLIKVYPELLI